MTRFDPFDIGFYLDKRQESKTYPGKFTLYLRVHSNIEKKKKYFGTKKVLTPRSWEQIQKAFIGSGSGLSSQEKEIREYLIAFRHEANKYNDPNKSKTLKQFSDLFKGDTNSDTDTLLIWVRFDQLIERKIEARKSDGTIKAYRDAKASFLRFDPTPEKLIYDIDISWLHQFIEYHIEIGNSEETAKSYLRQLRAVYIKK